jgi:hypothetical protein
VRLVCDSCGEVGPLTVDLRGDHARARCARCGASDTVAVLEDGAGCAAPSGDEEASAAARCPKCRARYGALPACPSCGLAVARMAGFAAARGADVSDEVRTAWDAVLVRWDAQPPHDAFVQAVAAAGAFAWAAGQYQNELLRRAGDRVAVRQLARLRRTAEAAMLASAVVRQPTVRPYRSATAILVMLVVVLVAGALYATLMRETRAGSGRPVVPAVPDGSRRVRLPPPLLHSAPPAVAPRAVEGSR